MTIEDKKQQENLKNFDRNLKESTDQLAWFLYWMFAAVVLVLGMTLIFDGIFYRDAWLILCYVWMVVFMDNYVLAPYQWSNEAFSRCMSDQRLYLPKHLEYSTNRYYCCYWLLLPEPESAEEFFHPDDSVSVLWNLQYLRSVLFR